MSVKGKTAYDRNLANATRSFEQWFRNSLGRELVTIDGIEQYAVFQDQNQNNNKELSDDKYIIAEKDSNMKVGSIVYWRNGIFMVFTDEYKTIPTHKQAKVKESNHNMKWMVEDGVCGNGQGYPAYIQNQTLYTLGVSTSGHHAWVVNAKMMMYMQDNEESRSIQIGQRIFIGGEVYQVMFKDYVSRKGLINYLLEQDFVNPSRDNVELGIADYYDSKDSDTREEPTGVSKEVIIDGAEKARIGSTLTYEASVFQDGTKVSDDITEWVIADTEAVATVVEQTPTSITIRIESNFQKVGSVINVIGKTTDGTIGSQSVNIISPY
jgi:hypothetical protein